MTTSTETYIRQFSDGVTAKATLSMKPPRLSVEWNGKLNPKIIGEYIAWRDGILNDFAAKTGERVLVVNLW